MVTAEQIQRGLCNYIETEIAQKAVGFNKFATYFILPSIKTKTADMINKYKDNELLADYFDKNGNVNLDQVYASAKDSIKKSGQFELFGIIFNETDIDKLYSAIQRG